MTFDTPNDGKNYLIACLEQTDATQARSFWTVGLLYCSSLDTRCAIPAPWDSVDLP